MNSISHNWSVSLLVLFLCFINSCPQIFTTILDNTPSNITHNYINHVKTPNYDSSSSLSSTQIKTLPSGHTSPNLNSVITEKGDLSARKLVVNKLLEGNFSSVYDDDQGYHNNSWWWDIIKEITEFLPSLSDCPGWKYRCFDNETRYPGFGRVCNCDSSCQAYGECCIDEAAISESEEINMKNRMYCGLLSRKERKGIYMIGNCLPKMKGSFEEELCLREVDKEIYGVILDIPVLSLDTNITYINYYCAFCNNDSNSFLHLDFSINCSPKYLSENDVNMTLSEFLLEAEYKPRQMTYERTLPPNENNETGLGKATSTVLGDNSTWRTSHLRTSTSPLSQICNVEISQYENVDSYASLYNSRTCIPSNEECSVKPDVKRESCTKQVTVCDSTWPIMSDFGKCQFYSMKVYDKSTNILYKNPHCAKCNFASLSKEQFSCNDLTAFYPLRSGFRPRFGEPFSILFQIPNQSPKRCPKRNEIWSPFDDRCSKIICGVGRVLKKGECVNSENEKNESNVTQHFSLLNNCPTIAVSNFTLYDNDSVYYYTGDQFYEKGDYELYNDSIILICAQSEIYFKKNFLITYYTTVAVLSISLVCLVFHISLYFCFSKLRTWHGRNLLSLCFSLFMAQLLFLTGTTATDNFGFCVFMAVCIHYFWLSSFFWMNVLSIDVLRTFKTKFTQNSNNNKVFLLYNLYSWGVPFIIVMLSLTLDLVSNDSKYKPYYAGFEEAELCWINNKIGLLCFFLLPVAIIITENLIFFTITSYKIYSQSKETRFARIKSQSVKIGNDQNDKIRKQEKANQSNKIRLLLYFKLGILQGLTWVFGFLASYVDSTFCWKIFTIFNGLQGAAILLCFDLKKWIFLSMWRKLDIDSLKLRFLKRTRKMPFENDLPREESGRKDLKETENCVPCKKGNTNFLNKAKESVMGSSFLRQPSLIFRSHQGSSSETPSDSCVATSKCNEKDSEHSKTSDLSDDISPSC